MEDTLHVRVDKQVISLLSINLWSNIVCIGLLVAINLVNVFRGDFSAAAAGMELGSERLLSPELLLLLSVVCIIWLAMRAINVLRVKRRMEHVFLRIEGSMISGISLAVSASSTREQANTRPFTIEVGAIRDVYLQEVQIVKKQQTPALIIKTDDDTFTVPGLAQLQLVRDSLTKRL